MSPVGTTPAPSPMQRRFPPQAVEETIQATPVAAAAALGAQPAPPVQAAPMTRRFPAGPVDETVQATPVGAPAAASALGLISVALSGPPISALGPWASLISFRPPTSVQRSTVDRGPAYADWTIHRLENAYGDINLDLYPVTVTRLPTGFATPDALLEHIRLNINDFVDTTVCDFAPYEDSDRSLWISASPVNAVIHINMSSWGVNVDDGSVICAERMPEHWIFSTLWTPGDGAHPVSGNRVFGFTSDATGGFTFFTRGADRTTTAADWAASGQVFAGADRLWTSFQQRLAAFANGHGGSAAVGAKVSERYDWPTVQGMHHHPSVSWI